MFDLKNTALFTLFGALGIFWSQVRQIFDRISSFVIVKAEFTGGYAESAFVGYLWKHFKYSRFGERHFLAHRTFIKPKGREGYVGFESVSKALTFFDGWKPMFVSRKSDKDNDNVSFTVNFIRGTFDITKIFADAVAEYDDLCRSSGGGRKRYTIKRCFGAKAYRGDAQPDSLRARSDNDFENGSPNPENKPIFWTKEDLTPVTSDKPFENLAYDQYILDFKSELKRWKESEQWYKSKGLNWRFGAGLFGPPGTGKTSFIRAIGQELDMPIHIYDLTTMDNQELVDFWKDSLTVGPCIVLFEDIDRIFDGEKNIKVNKDKNVTLDCLLNCINGVEPANGILVLITANDMSKLDPALGVPDSTGRSSRPGRLDRAVYFGALSLEGRKVIAERILSDCPQMIDKTILEGEGETGAQFENRCAKIALETYWGTPKVFAKEQSNASEAS